MLFIDETFIDVGIDCITGESGIQETKFDNVNDLFNHLKECYGDCVGHLLNEDKKIGWIFECDMNYDNRYEICEECDNLTCRGCEVNPDCKELKYKQRVLVEVHKSKPEIIFNYCEID